MEHSLKNMALCMLESDVHQCESRGRIRIFQAKKQWVHVEAGALFAFVPSTLTIGS